MSIRSIFLLMATLLLLTLAAGGYYAYYNWNKSILAEVQTHTQTSAQVLYNNIEAYLDNQRKPVRTLAALPALREALAAPGPAQLAAANALLDLFCANLNALTCYLMDSGGTTLASSNRDTEGSFVGKNYAFRPYFQQAIQGKPSIYLAVGVTSNKRGVYYSHPVLDAGRTLGVVVIKDTVSDIEHGFDRYPGIAALTGPDGVVFASNAGDWLLKSLWQRSDNDTGPAPGTRQFGDAPVSNLGLALTAPNQATGPDDTTYLVGQKDLAGFPGWQVVYLYDTRNVSENQQQALTHFISSGIGIFLLLIGLITLVLYLVGEREIKRRVAAEEAMHAAKDQAELANQTKTRFLSNMSHEFRTPLNAILGFGQIAELEQTPNSRSLDHIREIIHAGNHLLKLVDMLLDLSKIEAQKVDLNIEPVHCKSLLDECREMGRALARQHDVSIAFENSDPGLVMSVDRLRLKQILLNLVSNACKYNYPGGLVTVACEAVGDRVRISVTDTGKGIAAEHQGTLFTAYERFSQDKMLIQGTGLGLTIVKQLVEMMDGEIGFVSELGKGSTFWADFPGEAP